MTLVNTLKNEMFLNNIDDQTLCLFSEWLFIYSEIDIFPVHIMNDINRILKSYTPYRILSLINDTNFDLYDHFFTLNYDDYIITSITSFDTLDDYKEYLIIECEKNEIELEYLYNEYSKARNNNNLEKE